jgi:hypothetical protein
VQEGDNWRMKSPDWRRAVTVTLPARSPTPHAVQYSASSDWGATRSRRWENPQGHKWRWGQLSIKHTQQHSEIREGHFQISEHGVPMAHLWHSNKPENEELAWTGSQSHQGQREQARSPDEQKALKGEGVLPTSIYCLIPSANTALPWALG